MEAARTEKKDGTGSDAEGITICRAAVSGSISAVYTDFAEAVINWMRAGAGSVLTLYDDVCPDGGIAVSGGSKDAPMVLDLNGHKIDRALTSPTENGCVLIVGEGAHVVLADSSADGTGVLTGGSNLNSGGGVRVRGTLHMTGGAIRGNESAIVGGGVYVASGAVFLQDGGLIECNTAGSDGGGVYNDGTVTMRGGRISGNTARFRGGSVFNNGTVEADNVEMTGNKAGTFGGAIYNNQGEFKMNGGIVCGNAAGCGSGGVENYSTFSVSGAVTIRDNTASSGVTSNVRLLSSQYSLKVTGELTGGSVGVSCTSAKAGTVIAELCGDVSVLGISAEFFNSDDENYEITCDGSCLVLSDVREK